MQVDCSFFILFMTSLKFFIFILKSINLINTFAPCISQEPKGKPWHSQIKILWRGLVHQGAIYKDEGAQGCTLGSAGTWVRLQWEGTISSFKERKRGRSYRSLECGVSFSLVPSVTFLKGIVLGEPTGGEKGATYTWPPFPPSLIFQDSQVAGLSLEDRGLSIMIMWYIQVSLPG